MVETLAGPRFRTRFGDVFENFGKKCSCPVYRTVAVDLTFSCVRWVWMGRKSWAKIPNLKAQIRSGGSIVDWRSIRSPLVRRTGKQVGHVDDLIR